MIATARNGPLRAPSVLIRAESGALFRFPTAYNQSMARLNEYRRKRKFKQTPEPRGDSHPPVGNRFVVQEHHARRLHYDFRLEIDGVLKSWAVPKGPSMNPEDKRLAVQTEDHPLEYATFQGTIPAGHYGAGQVNIWDEGHFEPEGSVSASDQLKRGELKFTLDGKKLQGSFVLVRLRNRNVSKPEWLLIKHGSDAARRASSPVRVIPASTVAQGPAPPAAHAKNRAETKIKLPPGARRAPMPQFIRPALAELAAGPFSGPDWLFEIKWDGVRTLAAIRDSKVKLWSRSERDITREYPELSDTWRNVAAQEAWLDGEVVVLDADGRSDFQRLQLRFGVQKPSAKLLERAPVVYYVFDLLYLDGHDLCRAALLERKNLLAQVLRPDSHIRYSDHLLEHGDELFKAAAEQHLEGIVAKKIADPYPGRRTSSWLKIKLEKDVEAVVGGWTDPRGTREYFGALLLGLYGEKRLEFIGGVGTGFPVAFQQRLWPQLQNLRVSECPFAEEPATRERAYWVKPELVARVGFANWTTERQLRQPRFLGLVKDRPPRSCTFESQLEPARHEPAASQTSPHVGTDAEAVGKTNSTSRGRAKISRSSKLRGKESARRSPPGEPASSYAVVDTDGRIESELAGGTGEMMDVEIDGRRLHFTNLNKIYFPRDGYRKRDLLAHYLWAAPMIVPLLRDRPLVLRRYPNGIEEDAFFQKDAAKETPDWIKTTSIYSEDVGRVIRYILCNDRPTLLYLTNLGCIDHNPWSSRYNDQDHPDWIFFDLDPSEGASFSTVLHFGKLFLETLEQLEIKAFAKTSGATGFHIYIPMEPRYSYEQVRLFVQAVAEIVSRRSPGVLTSERTVRKRKPGSIYVDAHQNSRGQSLACAYSVRAFPGAPVSTPVRVADLRSEFNPQKWNLKTIRARIKKVGDLWADFWSSRQQLETLLKHSEP
jgi:bifunctional non-homologous end joining protein LigD